MGVQYINRLKGATHQPVFYSLLRYYRRLLEYFGSNVKKYVKIPVFVPYSRRNHVKCRE